MVDRSSTRCGDGSPEMRGGVEHRLQVGRPRCRKHCTFSDDVPSSPHVELEPPDGSARDELGWRHPCRGHQLAPSLTVPNAQSDRVSHRWSSYKSRSAARASRSAWICDRRPALPMPHSPPTSSPGWVAPRLLPSHFSGNTISPELCPIFGGILRIPRPCVIPLTPLPDGHR